MLFTSNEISYNGNFRDVFYIDGNLICYLRGNCELAVLGTLYNCFVQLYV